MLSFLVFLFWVVVFALPFAIPVIKGVSRESFKGLPWKSRLAWFLTGTIIMGFAGWARGLFVNVLWWNEEVHQTAVFWTRFWIKWQLFAVGAIVSFVVLSVSTFIARAALPTTDNKDVKERRLLTTLGGLVVSFIAAIIFGLVLKSHHMVVLQYLNKVPFGVTEPIFGKDAGFYVYTLPILWIVYWDVLALLLLVGGITAALHGADRWTIGENFDWHKRLGFIDAPKEGEANDELNWYKRRMNAVMWRYLATIAGLIMVVFAWGVKLSTWDLMWSGRGTVAGPGYTDVHVQIPANTTMLVTFVIAAIILFVASRMRLGKTAVVSAIGAFALIALVGMVGVGVIPAAVEHWKVAGNKVQYETPYVTNSIRFTRQAYALSEDRVEVQQFGDNGVPVPFTQEIADANPDVLNNVRLWDWRVLATTLSQIQTFRQYYDFADVDITRVRVDGKLRQVMLCLREMNTDRLTENTDSWFNRRFVYTHGYGYCMVPTNDFEVNSGLPVLWVKNIPMSSTIPGYDKVEPRVYYGERTVDRVYVNSRQGEFDYPQGDQNVYGHYQGLGGVRLGSGFRKLAFAFEDGGIRLLLANEMTDSTKVMWDRDIKSRVAKLAPFLKYDRDVYAVPSPEEGKLYLVVDGYTHTNHYPYAESCDDLNYVRNAVKVVLDCYNGTTTYYIFDEQDPLIKVWAKVFPTLFRPKSEMPVGVMEHVRYPEDMLSVQSRVYGTYHMTDPQTWINKEDLWDVAHEVFGSEDAAHTQQVLPYFVVTHLDGEPSSEFLQMVPFTPYTKEGQQKRNNMVAWMAGRADGAAYGKLRVYLFSKQATIQGPLMIENRINQDPNASRDITLWGDPQRGSRVVQGNLLVIPVGKSLIYVEPIYLQATAGTGIPEIRKVAVATQDRMAWEDSFEKSLASLLGSSYAEETAMSPTTLTTGSSQHALIRQAGEHWRRYLELERGGAFAKAGQEKEALGKVIETLFQTAGADSAK